MDNQAAHLLPSNSKEPLNAERATYLAILKELLSPLMATLQLRSIVC